MSSEATTTANDTGGGSALALAQDENESYMRYEFSETRKVLDEFFHKDPAENDRWVQTCPNWSKIDVNFLIKMNAIIKNAIWNPNSSTKILQKMTTVYVSP